MCQTSPISQLIQTISGSSDINALYSTNIVKFQKWSRFDYGKIEKPSHNFLFHEGSETCNNQVAVLMKHIY